MPGPKKSQRRYYSLSSEFLKILRDKEGDEEANDVLEDREIVRDLATNPYTQYGEPQIRLAPRVWIKFRKDGTGRVYMWLEMNEDVNPEKIKSCWKEIRQWQDFLRDWQGPSKFGTENYVNHLHLLHKQGFSYAHIVQLVKDEALSSLQWIQNKKFEKFEAALARIDKWSEEETKHWKSECGAGLEKFRLAGGRDEELIVLWWKDALKYLASNRKRPIRADIPLTRQNIIETLRAFRKRFELKDEVGKIG